MSFTFKEYYRVTICEQQALISPELWFSSTVPKTEKSRSNTRHFWRYRGEHWNNQLKVFKVVASGNREGERIKNEGKELCRFIFLARQHCGWLIHGLDTGLWVSGHRIFRTHNWAHHGCAGTLSPPFSRTLIVRFSSVLNWLSSFINKPNENQRKTLPI